MIGEPLWKMNFYKCHSVVLGFKKKKKKTLAERNKIAAFQNRVVRKTNSCHGMGNTPQKKKSTNKNESISLDFGKTLTYFTSLP